MTYRRLSREELEGLQPQFVRFLAAQGIDADLWAKMKATDEARAEQLVDRFSAMVYDDVLRRAEYLEQRSERQLMVYKCGPDKVELRGLLVEGGGGGLDLRRVLSPAEMTAAVQQSGATVKAVRAERSYKGSREEDVFGMLEQGARIGTSGELWALLDGLN